VAQKYNLVPVNRAGATLIVAVCDPSNLFAIEDIKFMTGYNVEMVVTSEADIKAAIDKYYDQSATLADVIDNLDLEELELVDTEDEVDISSLERSTEEAPVVKLVNLILMDAIKKKASDIHIEPYEKLFRVRYRIDGVLYEVMKPPLKLKNAITSRIKIMAELDIAERRLPQDGRIKIKLGGGKDMDFRVSVLPTLFGEKIVLRLLDKSSLQLDMTKLGYEAEALAHFKREIHKPFGMVLVTGPTGSGKTVSLYSALSELNKVTENISTAEDPVEFNFAGINQVQMREDIGLNFAAALRSFLRQDPDIIMIGEIRDSRPPNRGQGCSDRPSGAFYPAHQRCSIHHQPPAEHGDRAVSGGICRKSDHCPAPGAPDMQRMQGEGEYPAQGSDRCRCSGKRGGGVCLLQGAWLSSLQQHRLQGADSFYQVMPMLEPIRELILNGANTAEIKRETMRLGIKTMRQAALTKLKEGVTSLEEVLRVTVADD